MDPAEQVRLLILICVVLAILATSWVVLALRYRHATIRMKERWESLYRELQQEHRETLKTLALWQRRANAYEELVDDNEKIESAIESIQKAAQERWRDDA